jgi:SAM-dependent methyltransferase
MSNTPAPNPQRLNEFMGRFVGDLGAGLHMPTVLIGEKLGLYKALAKSGPMSPGELAKATHTHERYIREWLSSQAAAGYVSLSPDGGTFFLNPEQAFALADENSPAYVPGAFYIVASAFKDEPKILEAFRTGRGVGWHEHSPDLFEGTNKFFRPGYLAHLTSEWLPALDGMVPRLERGGTVADVGCGLGSSTLLMAATYPQSKFVGFDYHGPSIEAARAAAAAAGVGDRVRFEVATAKDYPGKDFDLITFFDCLHDMGDPAGAAQHARQALAPEGTWMVVEPFANATLSENLNPVGRIFYSASTMICTGASLDQEVGAALGAQASDRQLEEVARGGGFSRFRRATATPFNRVFEIRP